MAIGEQSTFKIYPEQFYGGMIEAVDQNIQVFNAASRGAIILDSRLIRGHYQYESFLADIASLVTRRDITDVSAATDLDWTQEEFISVKINRKIGPVAKTLDAWKKISRNEREFSFKMGQKAGLEKMKDMVNTAILAVEAALEGQAALNFDATAETTKTMTHTHLVSGLAKFGDLSASIVTWVAHAKPAHDLLKQAIADNVLNVASIPIIQGSVPTLGRPLVMVDAPALFDDNGSLTDTYNTLGLVEGAVRITESESETIAFELVTGLENLVHRFQGEYAYNVQIKGFKWDVANGGVNPTDAALGTTTNWDKAATANKNMAGVRIKSQ